jgi:hypothetical protein
MNLDQYLSRTGILYFNVRDNVERLASLFE